MGFKNRYNDDDDDDDGGGDDDNDNNTHTHSYTYTQIILQVVVFGGYAVQHNHQDVYQSHQMVVYVVLVVIMEMDMYGILEVVCSKVQCVVMCSVLIVCVCIVGIPRITKFLTA